MVPFFVHPGAAGSLEFRPAQQARVQHSAQSALHQFLYLLSVVGSTFGGPTQLALTRFIFWGFNAPPITVTLSFGSDLTGGASVAAVSPI